MSNVVRVGGLVVLFVVVVLLNIWWIGHIWN